MNVQNVIDGIDRDIKSRCGFRPIIIKSDSDGRHEFVDPADEIIAVLQKTGDGFGIESSITPYITARFQGRTADIEEIFQELASRFFEDRDAAMKTLRNISAAFTIINKEENVNAIDPWGSRVSKIVRSIKYEVVEYMSLHSIIEQSKSRGQVGSRVIGEEISDVGSGLGILADIRYNDYLKQQTKKRGKRNTSGITLRRRKLQIRA